ncbi:hypothetical protein AOL_s00097g531 [Orbilia oligospora ATCC 24927]|uniref:VWFA domain-containing protein n=1 Tax=Arthrobotrys oligospora (strain ATCC 24927 / CBS 115.81 / DSM 1491) TaxID=756982 RepID=G1XJK4_ARTOA|nr:hypothetical protein AOL_s00097g531 [Orbilia oligospora ATCC 24927]EGX46627.1 hypothetical protein AOL_s00097g531 [Orbilia oligospora ATCC 24927]
MSIFRKIRKSLQESDYSSSSSSSHQYGHSTRAGAAPPTNPFSKPSANGPPPYTPVGAAASYYGNTPQPQYPPIQPSQNYQQAPPMMQPQQPQPPMHSTPNPLINPNTLPLPSMNPNMGADDPYTFLRDFDTVVVVDDSGSMSGGRWNQTAAALSAVVPIITFYDSDGIDVYFLNAPDRPHNHNIRTPAQVMEIFGTVRPQGSTPTGRALKRILEPYMEKYERNPNRVKPLNIIVITDGVPTDDVESHIVKYAKKLDRLDADLTQVGIQFFQIGSDPEATIALRELDDSLGEMRDVRDMVDTVPWTGSLEGERMLKVVLGAVNKRLDRKKF